METTYSHTRTHCGPTKQTRHLTLTVSLSTPEYKMGTDDKMLGDNLRWISMPSRGSSNTPSRLHAKETGVSSGSVGQFGQSAAFIFILIQYCFFIAGYKKTPEIKYYFQPRNRNDTHPTNFEIITQNETSGVFAYIRNRNRIPGPKIFFLEFRGDVHDSQTGDLVSRFVHNMYVFVSRYNF